MMLLCQTAFATTKFMEPGGDATFDTSLWSAIVGTPSIATDILHGGHIKSISFRANNNDEVNENGVAADSGGRISVYIYMKTLPNATATIFATCQTTHANNVIRLRMTSAGVLQLQNSAGAQLGSNGSTLAVGKWYRVCMTWNITNTTTNSGRIFVNGVQDITFTNATLTFATSADTRFGNISTNATQDMRISDIYIDNGTGNTDTGDVWVTAKRPFANGTTNNFVTQIGSGGSSYGTGHAPQVNERALSITNGWSVVAVGSAVTEEYNIESAGAGDISILPGTIVDVAGWVDTKALVGETGSLILNGATSNISITTSATIFIAYAGSTSYPAGTGADIGEITSTAATTVSLYECGVMVAYKPNPGNFFLGA